MYYISNQAASVSLKYFYLCGSSCLKPSNFQTKLQKRTINVCHLTSQCKLLNLHLRPRVVCETFETPSTQKRFINALLLTPPPDPHQHTSLQPIRHLPTNHRKTLPRPKRSVANLAALLTFPTQSRLLNVMNETHSFFIQRGIYSSNSHLQTIMCRAVTLFSKARCPELCNATATRETLIS